MKITIVYDSVFGNTADIANAIHEAAVENHLCEIFRVTEVVNADISQTDLLIVGSPTRAFSPTPAITNFIRSMPTGALRGKQIAAFDTRIKMEDIHSKALRFMVKIGGYAAGTIAKRLEKKGGKLVEPPEGFFVNGEEGPLGEDENDRAKTWAKGLILKAETK